MLITNKVNGNFLNSDSSSASVPVSYSTRLTDLHDTTSRITSKERTETNGNVLSYRRSSKTDGDVAATLEKYGLKSDTYRLRNDSMPNRFLNTTNLDSRHSSNRKLSGISSLELSKLSPSSSKPPKSVLNSRLQRKDSLTKSETTDAGLGPIASIERKLSSSAVGGSSSPIEIRKSEVWDQKLSISYGENMSRAGFESNLFRKVGSKSQSRLMSRENKEDDSLFVENIDGEEKTLTFEEIRKKFDGNDVITLKGGFEKSSQEESKGSISNGVILGVHNFGQVQYLDRHSKNKSVDNFENEVESDTGENGNSQADSIGILSYPQPLRRTVLKPIPGNNNSCLRKSPEPTGETGTSAKKRSSPEMKKSLSPEKKDGAFSSLAKLPGIPAAETNSSSIAEKKSNEGSNMNVIEAKREARNACINSKLGLDNRSDLKITPKMKGEKLLAKVEQTLSKQSGLDNEMLNTLSRMKKSPETKPKDYENQTKVIELRRIETNVTSPFEAEERRLRDEFKERRSEVQCEKPGENELVTATTTSDTITLKSTERTLRSSPSEEVSDATLEKDEETDANSQVPKEGSPSLKMKDRSSPKEEKDSQNIKERALNKKFLMDELTKDIKCLRKEEKTETPMWDKQEMSNNANSRSIGGQASTSQSSNPSSFNKRVEHSSLTGTSPRSSLGRSRNSGEKGGLNGLKNIGNTCFMNSVLQCLSNTKPLLEYLLNEEYMTDINFTISAMKGSLIKAFSNVIQELWAPNVEDRIINTTNFKSQIQKFAPRFMGYAQQDAQEFLRYLLEGLHEDVNRVTVKPQQILTDIDDSLSDNQKATEAWKRYLRMEDSKVMDIFVGQLKSTLQCTVCGHCSVTFDPFWDLSLPVPSRTGQPRLSSCLDAFTKEEVLDGEEKPTCSKCETRRKCTKSFSIQKFPKILVLHLKRFSPTERYRGKLSITVDFPLTSLDLSPYAANKGQGCTYNLYAISNHSGTAYGGHYTAYCKHPYTGNWHEYNDSRVSSLSSRSVVSGEAYVLFYELATQTSHL
ncbi:hypothetical protein RUM43_001311 [Polyplax serrata]|uniref:ubiquitinyl hydrolase 1 n=1 Tax=Polyplax serrata TaxID=468196 RepID=A0AAN8SIU9_POLSC